MQTIEMLKKRERVLALEIQILIVVIRRQSSDMAALIKQYLPLRQQFLWDAEYSEQARKRCKRYYKAWQSGNVLEASLHAECKANDTRPADTVEGAIARIVQLDYERRGLADNIKWLDDAICGIEQRGPSLFLNFLGDINDPSEPVEGVSLDFPSLAWSDQNRVVRNRAYHEICVKFGLKRLRRAVQADIKGPDGCDPEFGRILRRDYAQLLVNKFLITNPDPALVGTVS